MLLGSLLLNLVLQIDGISDDLEGVDCVASDGMAIFDSYLLLRCLFTIILSLLLHSKCLIKYVDYLLNFLARGFL